MDWYCVHIEDLHLTQAVNTTFCKMLTDEYRANGEPLDWRVHLRADPNGSYSYFFSPGAAKSLETFMRFWGGVGCPEPTNLHQMEVVLSSTRGTHDHSETPEVSGDGTYPRPIERLKRVHNVDDPSIEGSYTTHDGMTFTYEATWKQLGSRIAWNAIIRRDGMEIGWPYGKIDFAPDTALAVAIALHNSIEQGFEVSELPWFSTFRLRPD